jgi:phytol kinase
MLHLFYAIAGTAFLFVVTENIWRSKKISHESTRKFLHISLGTFIAFWPFFLSWASIYLLVLVFIAGIIVARNSKKLSKRFTIFKTINKLDRHSYGEIYFSLGIGLTALLTHNKYIFMAAILNLSIADGLAALIGKKYGSESLYIVFGAKKSIVGSLTFLVFSLAILLFFYVVSGYNPSVAMIILLPPILTFVESLSSSGVDNLVLPLTVLIALKNF